MRYLAILLTIVAIGCSKPPLSDDIATYDTTQGTVEADSERPWAGLKIQSAGVLLEEAAQIVVLLHGYGATESDLVPLANYISGESRAFVFPAAPVTVDGGGLAWATTEGEFAIAHQRLLALVRFVSKTYPKAEIAVGGFSQGATVSSMLLTDSTLPIRHLILYSPALAIDAASIDAARNIQVLLAHGQRDDVLPFADSARLYEMLQQKGIKTNWVPFDDGHTITPELLDATRNQLSN